MTRFLFVSVAMTCALAGCQRQANQDSSPAGAESVAAATLTTELVPGTPAGDIEEWVSEMRAGLDTVTALLATDRLAAHRKVLGLYMNRQEFLEVYYGVGGRLLPTKTLAEAVDTNEERFHELMRMTELSPAASEAEVRRAIGEVGRQMEVVLLEARTTPHRIRAVADSLQGTR